MATRSWNRVELIGNLTRDPELRYTPSGAAVVTFTIATNRTYVTDGEKREDVDYHRCVAWNKLAELCDQLLKKGNRTFVSGRLQNRSWEGQDGQTRQVTEIVIEDMLVLTNRTDFAGSDEPADRVEPSLNRPAPQEAVEDITMMEENPKTAETAPEPTEADEKPTKKDKKASETAKEEIDIDDLPF